ncbi:hypothetical protein SGRA_2271 [Saprospira grandis str. Lewin]|uniref:Uncharacterized protein n=1 Tax=Saprospira grandis (strain Lewin) TaxID=984262 RepID=H6L3Q2_SAPGL|nr:hypothetical protein SGRA_2271 [Saprospira grandis str. Lewin]
MALDAKGRSDFPTAPFLSFSGPLGPFVELAQRCAAVAEGQTQGETKWSLQGRADLRAA